ncbi:metal-dependent transcriptional regulator [Hydrogenovibrio sp. SC-1]|uniref:metal-dependent transcriptional regulator n=1 Tax=Hydrogenovibrio sp. SC-1 TaxID=2065820 RepID=UPI000C7B57B6|nr:metal-dependent transcriptional regulator [Hydrogenovibrio sp. SC-1]PLA74763.1 metal-dependent transcriptional regulator [Hydrogenovibrio sp. SC-1]
MASQALEDYLKIIFKLEEVNAESGLDKGISTSAIAERLSISQASVSNMLKKLSEKKFIEYAPYYGVTLTDQGRKIALKMLRRHRVLELYLVERLGYQWDEVDAEAEVMEHAVSDRLVNRMWEELGRPTQDPHGSPIPDQHGNMEVQKMVSLCEATPDESCQVIRIQNRTPEELRYLFSMGLVKGAQVKVFEKAPFEGPLSVEVDGTQFALDFRLAQSIFVA